MNTKTCKLTTASDPECTALAVVTVVDSEGTSAAGCLSHAIQALRTIDGSRVDWKRTHVNEMGRKALQLTEHSENLGR